VSITVLWFALTELILLGVRLLLVACRVITRVVAVRRGVHVRHFLLLLVLLEASLIKVFMSHRRLGPRLKAVLVPWSHVKLSFLVRIGQLTETFLIKVIQLSMLIQGTLQVHWGALHRGLTIYYGRILTCPLMFGDTIRACIYDIGIISHAILRVMVAEGRCFHIIAKVIVGVLPVPSNEFRVCML
jgi:hypothetical protein